MFYVTKTLSISSSHILDHLPYDSKCKNLHGHNWKITIYCRASTLNNEGMVIDFKKISEIVNKLDHNHLNNFVKIPTAENLAKYICEEVPYCYKTDVSEMDNHIVTYISGEE